MLPHALINNCTSFTPPTTPSERFPRGYITLVPGAAKVNWHSLSYLLHTLTQAKPTQTYSLQLHQKLSNVICVMRLCVLTEGNGILSGLGSLSTLPFNKTVSVDCTAQAQQLISPCLLWLLLCCGYSST